MPTCVRLGTRKVQEMNQHIPDTTSKVAHVLGVMYLLLNTYTQTNNSIVWWQKWAQTFSSLQIILHLITQHDG